MTVELHGSSEQQRHRWRWASQVNDDAVSQVYKDVSSALWKITPRAISSAAVVVPVGSFTGPTQLFNSFSSRAGLRHRLKAKTRVGWLRSTGRVSGAQRLPPFAHVMARTRSASPDNILPPLTTRMIDCTIKARGSLIK